MESLLISELSFESHITSIFKIAVLKDSIATWLILAHFTHYFHIFLTDKIKFSDKFASKEASIKNESSCDCHVVFLGI